MTETQKRIKAYQAELPGLKEKVAAVALLLVMSMAMMTSATFAWITISRSPEVSGVNTTIAANGNLEIALVNPEGLEPGESGIGDSSAAKGQSVADANLTWGNLVNLSDEIYGLENIVLRPALLGNTNNLLEQPLKGVDYGEDGRVELYYNEDFQFTNWVPPEDGNPGYFHFYNTPRYGVRALSTVKYEYVNSDFAQFTQMMRYVSASWEQVEAKYQAMLTYDVKTDQYDYISTLAGLIGDFMTDKLNDKNGTTDISKYMPAVVALLQEFESVVDSFYDPIVALANAQVYNKYGRENYSSYTYTNESFAASTAAERAANGIDSQLEAVLTQYAKIKKELGEVLYGTDTINGFEDYYQSVQNGGKVTFADITSLINRLVNIDKCQIIAPNGTVYTAGSLGMSAATQLLGKTIDAKITYGLLKDFEQFSGFRLCATNVDVKATYMITVTMTAKTITTNATDPSDFDKAETSTEETAASNKGDFTGMAQDTYGMAMDFWVRTNAVNSYLILEGNVLTETNTVRSVGVDINGNEVELYMVTITTELVDEATGEATTINDNVKVYPIMEEDQTGNLVEVWRRADTHALLYNEDGSVPEGQQISTPVPAMDEVTTVIGYEGENRVWNDESKMIGTDATTQGSGSCYVFYADDPGQQENSLRLLSNLRVAFVDADPNSELYGKMIATAQLDIERRFEESGKVILPLVLVDDNSSYLTKTEDGDLAIMPLEQNTAERLMTFVYLDGRDITNADVLAANEIHGQLNIQFGTYFLDPETGEQGTMTPADDETLELATRSVTVESKKSTDAEFSGNPAITYDFDTETGEMKVDVRVKVTGDVPAKVTAFFMRQVNATQGSREPVFTLTQDPADSSIWTGSYVFTAPGNYILRTVQLDGVDYSLPVTEGSYPKVSITGFAISDVALIYEGIAMTEASKSIMTSGRNVSADLTLQFASNLQKMPKSVKLQFSSDNSQVTATLTYDSSSATWTGTANFATSGVYTLKQVIMDGEYTELDARFQKTLDITMGITVRVDDYGNEALRNVTYEGNSYTVPMKVYIFNDLGRELKYLNGVKLFYTRNGSNVNGMNPDMKWNAAENCYTGNLMVPGPGIYKFTSVQVGTNNLKSAVNVPPIYTCISPEPPVYMGAVSTGLDPYELDMNANRNDLHLAVKIENATAANVTAMFYNADKNTTVAVAGELAVGSDDTFQFLIPVDQATGYQIGNWTITQLMLTNVYTGEGSNLVLHDEANPLVWQITDANDQQILSVVVVNVKVTMAGEDENLDGGYFMGEASAEKSVTLTITDQNNKPLNLDYLDITDVVMTYKYVPNSSRTYGHYYSADADAAVADITLTGTLGADGKTVTMSKPTFVYAGEYEGYSLTLKVVDKNNSDNNANARYTSEERYDPTNNNYEKLDMPVYTLSTAAPSLTITAVTPTGTYSIDQTTSGKLDDGSAKKENERQSTGCNPETIWDWRYTTNTKHKPGYQSSISADGKVATVYFKCDHTDAATYISGSGTTEAGTKTFHHYVYDTSGGTPTVTIRLSDTGKMFSVTGSSASLEFKPASGTEVRMFTAYSSGNLGLGTGLAGQYYYTADGQKTSTYTWSSETTCMRYIGSMTQFAEESGLMKDRNGNDTKVPAGTITANVLTVVYGGHTYTFDVEMITINNPY